MEELSFLWQIPEIRVGIIFTIFSLAAVIILAVLVSRYFPSFLGVLVGFLIYLGGTAFFAHLIFQAIFVHGFWVTFILALKSYFNLVYFVLVTLLIVLRNKKSAKIKPMDRSERIEPRLTSSATQRIE